MSALASMDQLAAHAACLWLSGLVGGMMQGSDLIALYFSVMSIFAGAATLVVDLWEVGVILRQKRSRTRGASLCQKSMRATLKTVIAR